MKFFILGSASGRGAQSTAHFLFSGRVCRRLLGDLHTVVDAGSKINWAATGWKMAPTSESAAGRCLFVLLGLQIVRAATIQQQSTLKHPLVVLMLDGYVFCFSPARRSRVSRKKSTGILNKQSGGASHAPRHSKLSCLVFVSLCERESGFASPNAAAYTPNETIRERVNLMESAFLFITWAARAFFSIMQIVPFVYTLFKWAVCA